MRMQRDRSTETQGWRARAGRAARHACLWLLPLVAGACAHGQASTVAELPPLDMPAPPPRIVEAAEPPQSPIVSLPDEPQTPVRTRPTAPARTDAPRSTEPPRADVVVSETPKPADDQPRTPPTTLQTTPTQREGEVERRVRILISQALNDLNRVNYQALNADARNQYDTAKRFATQAEEALRARNLVFANNLADKAAALAAQLFGR